MTCGIYKLIFKGTNKVYIGQSDNIERRFVQHLNNAKNSTWPRKLQEAYNNFGAPSLEILLDCEISELNYLENLAINLYDSFNNGFNGVEFANTMPNLVGELNGSSIYSNEDIIKVAEFLQNPKLCLLEISKLTNVSYDMIRMIATCQKHTWISNARPDLWQGIVHLKGTRRSYAKCAESLGIVYPQIIDTQGNIYSVKNIRAFAREHNLNPGHLHSLLNNRSKTHKGWKLAQ